MTDRRAISKEIQEVVGKILGHKYDGLHFQGIQHNKKTGELGIAKKYGSQYSENNMGFGEGRVFYLVDLLENSPEHSFFVIEEPETALHGHAQHQLVSYLLDVSLRRHHQIIMTTHSDKILSVLPSKARLLVQRSEIGVQVYQGLSSTRVRAVLSRGYEKDLIVFVEDEFAEILLQEMVRSIDDSLLKAIDITSCGGKNFVRNAVKMMKDVKKNAMAVRDADVGENPADDLFSFPGSLPPEKEVFYNQAVKLWVKEQFSLDIDNVISIEGVTDHHQIPSVLAKETSCKEDFIVTMAVKEYIKNIGVAEYKYLVNEIDKRA